MPEPVSFATLILREAGAVSMHVAPLPVEVADAFAGVRRVLATFDRVTVRRALVPRAGGGRVLALSRDLLQQIGKAYGETVIVTLAADPEPDRIDLGPLADALAANDAARARWETFTPGRQRSMAHVKIGDMISLLDVVPAAPLDPRRL